MPGRAEGLAPWFPFVRRASPMRLSRAAGAGTSAIPVEIVRRTRPGRLRRPSPEMGRRAFFAWIGRNRRLAKDFEATIDSGRAFLYAASAMLLLRRLAQSG